MKKKTLVIKSFPQQNILKIPNNFLRASYKCSATTQRMYFYSIFKYLSSPDEKSCVSFSFSDFFSDLNLRDGQKTRKLIKESANEILDMKIILEDNERQYEVTNVFQSAKCIFTETTFSFKFTEDMKIFLDELKEIGFSLFEINDLGKLKSFYALRYYLIALSFKGFKGKKGNIKNSWFFEYSLEDLRKIFDIAENEYTQIGSFKRVVIDLPLKELNEKNIGMQIICTPVKKSRRIAGFRFDCMDSTKMKAAPERTAGGKTEPPRLEGREFREDYFPDGKSGSLEEAISIISENPARYAALLEEEKANPSLFGLSPETQAIIRLKNELERQREGL